MNGWKALEALYNGRVIRRARWATTKTMYNRCWQMSDFDGQRSIAVLKDGQVVGDATRGGLTMLLNNDDWEIVI
jgi:sulfur carrier protein ThiS